MESKYISNLVWYDSDNLPDHSCNVLIKTIYDTITNVSYYEPLKLFNASENLQGKYGIEPKEIKYWAKLSDPEEEEVKIMNNWISTKDRLPSENGEYLCSVKLLFGGNKITIYKFSKDLSTVQYNFDKNTYVGKSGFYGEDDEYGFYEATGVVAWQQLPEPYEEN